MAMFVASKLASVGVDAQRVQQMKLNSKFAWGLAWTGLAVVLAVPSADFLTGQFGRGSTGTALITSTTDPVKTGSIEGPAATSASVTTKVTKTGVTIVPTKTAAAKVTVLDPVDKLLKTGKPLPNYISDDSSTVAPSKGATEEPTQVATLDPAPKLVAPTPFPGRPADLARPVLPKTPKQPTVIVDDEAMVNDDDAMPDRLAVNGGPVPPAGISDDWRSARDRRLTRYLENNGLIDNGSADGRSSASVAVVKRPPSDYDPDGFYLSDGPNNSKASRQARIERMLEDDDSDDIDWF